MIGHQRGGDRRDVLGQLMLEMRGVGDMDLARARDLGGGFGNTADARSSNEQMDFAQLRGGGDGCEGGVFDGAAIMFDEDERLHLATPIALSLSTSSSTDATLIPAWRLGGSTTFSVSSRGATSTP